MGEMCRQGVGENWVLERETLVELSLGFRVLRPPQLFPLESTPAQEDTTSENALLKVEP